MYARIIPASANIPLSQHCPLSTVWWFNHGWYHSVHVCHAKCVWQGALGVYAGVFWIDSKFTPRWKANEAHLHRITASISNWRNFFSPMLCRSRSQFPVIFRWRVSEEATMEGFCTSVALKMPRRHRKSSVAGGWKKMMPQLTCREEWFGASDCCIRRVTGRPIML